MDFCFGVFSGRETSCLLSVNVVQLYSGVAFQSSVFRQRGCITFSYVKVFFCSLQWCLQDVRDRFGVSSPTLTNFTSPNRIFTKGLLSERREGGKERGVTFIMPFQKGLKGICVCVLPKDRKPTPGCQSALRPFTLTFAVPSALPGREHDTARPECRP